MKKIILIIYIILTANIIATAQKRCFDYLLFDGSEQLHSYGMDTTFNWWAVTQPFTGKYRLIVNGEETEAFDDLSYPIFSPDGERWAAFAEVSGRRYLITESERISLNSDGFGKIFFNNTSKILAYSYYQGNMEIIQVGTTRYEVLNRIGDFFIDENGYQIAFTGARADGIVVNINGEESTVYKDVIPIGFWYDGTFMYAAGIGNGWQIYQGNKAITQVFEEIREAKINLKGDALGFSAQLQDGDMVGVLISDDYREPLIGKRYSSVYNVTLHPHLPMIAYNATLRGQNMVVLNNTDYGGRVEIGRPYFTFDGYDLYFLTCDVDCYINISGQQLSLRNQIGANTEIAVAPNTGTYAFSTNSTMMVHHIDENRRYAGMMVDRLIAPTYSWRDKEYQTLGDINNRLYLLTCRFE